MCKKRYHNRIDKCMKNLIRVLNDKGIKTKACCCGHKKYPMTIIAWDHMLIANVEIMSMKVIPRTRNFYKKDNQGIYFIPEVSKDHLKNV